MVVYRTPNPENTTQCVTIRIPVRLRAFAREQKISLSGTLREILEAEYRAEYVRAPTTNHSPNVPRKPTKMNTEAGTGLVISPSNGAVGR